MPRRLVLSTLIVAGALVGAAVPAHAQPAPMRDLAWTDQTSRAFGPRALAGRPVLLHFVYTGCSSTCPLQVRQLVQLRDSLPAPVRTQLRIVSVSVDPRQDTPAALQAFARAQGADQPGWHFLTGPGADALSDRLRALPTPRGLPAEHRTQLYLYDARGALVQRYAGVPVDVARLRDEITPLSTQKNSP